MTSPRANLVKACAAAVLLVFGTGGAAAEPLSGAALRERIAGSELRFSGPGYYNRQEHHLHRFRPDGWVDGQIHFVTDDWYGRYIELYDTGRWHIEGGERVCVDWDRRFYWWRNGRLCFTIEPRDGFFVTIRTDEGRSYLGTLHPWRR